MRSHCQSGGASVAFLFPTSVHKDVSERLKHINPSLHREVATVLEQNKQERHVRGGEATRQKYMQQKVCADPLSENG
ncbi:MAG: sporulation transcriptional regulator SpoIIID [Clostridia bacterium]|nr:sporulation transcriptional regulator SpoIIID [Clostridia bacterium]MBR6745448.1 sporulation transcriptional regulator SpoIIID [Clostridia bacterium]